MKIKAPKFARNLYANITDKINKNIRAQLIVTFFICIILSTGVYKFVNSYYKNNDRTSTVDYTLSINEISQVSTDISDEILRNGFNISDSENIKKLIDDYSTNNESNKILITDLNGKVLYKSSNATDSVIDIYSLLQSVMKSKNSYNNENGERNEYVTLYPVNFKDAKTYLIVKGIPQGRVMYSERNQVSFTALILFPLTFIFSFLYLTRRKMDYITYLSNGLMEISRGNLDYRVSTIGEDELASLAGNINHMAGELQEKIKTERELISNVSHDLRTPLTSIMGYLGLIKDRKYKDEEQMEEYLEISYNKSEKLRYLVEDLFEYTKLTDSGTKLKLEKVALNEFLEQLVEELMPIFEESKHLILKDILNEKIIVEVDTCKLLRVFENLLMNAVKYSYPEEPIKIALNKDNSHVTVCVQNKGDNIKPDDLKKIFDRFYRIDKSRTTTTGGSGLGLAISKSIIELHGGKIWAECENNVISFYVRLTHRLNK